MAAVAAVETMAATTTTTMTIDDDDDEGNGDGNRRCLMDARVKVGPCWPLAQGWGQVTNLKGRTNPQKGGSSTLRRPSPLRSVKPPRELILFIRESAWKMRSHFLSSIRE